MQRIALPRCGSLYCSPDDEGNRGAPVMSLSHIIPFLRNDRTIKPWDQTPRCIRARTFRVFDIVLIGRGYVLLSLHPKRKIPPMLQFAFAIYAIVFSVVSGVMAVAVILAGYFSFPTMIAAMIAGALLSFPVTYAILKQMDWRVPDKRHDAKPECWHIR
jgi:peptidoglycan/LPS O-acetylase OafA/YrhL